jgi:hypothetical protein
MRKGSVSCSAPYESDNESHLPALRSGFGAGLPTPCQPALPCCASAQPPFADLLSRSRFWPCAHGPLHPSSAGPVPVPCKVHAKTGSGFTPHQTSLAPAEGLHRKASETTMSAIVLHSYASQCQMRGCEQAFRNRVPCYEHFVELTHLSGHVRSRLPVPVLLLFDALFQCSNLHSCSISDLQHVVPLLAASNRSKT